MEDNIKMFDLKPSDDFRFQWVSESTACEKCQEMNGNIYDSANEIPDKPHPNCKCHINLIEKDTGEFITDPLEARRKRAKTRKMYELARLKLLGDAKSLEEEIDGYIKKIDEQDSEIEQFENTIDTSKLEPKDKQKFDDMKGKVEYAKYKGEKLKEETKTLEIQIEKTVCSHEEISRLQLKLVKLQQMKEDFIVKNAELWNTVFVGCMYSKLMNMPEAYDFFKIAVDKKNHNIDYVNKNGKLYDSIEDLHNYKLSKDIKSRIAQESNQKDCKVLVLNSNSSVAQKIQKSNALKKFLTDNIESIRRNGTAPDTTIEFSNLDKDLYSTFHGAEVKDTRVDSEGNLNIRIEDYYNFNPDRTSVKGRVGEKLQNQGDLEPYYVITVLKIPKEVWQKY